MPKRQLNLEVPSTLACGCHMINYPGGETELTYCRIHTNAFDLYRALEALIEAHPFSDDPLYLNAHMVIAKTRGLQ